MWQKLVYPFCTGFKCDNHRVWFSHPVIYSSIVILPRGKWDKLVKMLSKTKPTFPIRQNCSILQESYKSHIWHKITVVKITSPRDFNHCMKMLKILGWSRISIQAILNLTRILTYWKLFNLTHNSKIYINHTDLNHITTWFSPKNFQNFVQNFALNPNIKPILI